MAYSDFTIAKIKNNLGLTLVESMGVFNSIHTYLPSSRLEELVAESLPYVLARSSEKARSELIVSPVLMELRNIRNSEITVFSGEDFNVDPSRGLNGTFDFLVTRSTEKYEVEAPAIVLVEAKKSDLASGVPQCIAEMYAAQEFNRIQGEEVSTIYGCVTSALAWKFIKLEGEVVTIDLMEYYIPPVDKILGILYSMV